VIRNAVIHILNEQPLLADLFDLPSSSDVGLRCTNLRTLSGTRPIFVDSSESTFFFPYLNIRFIEVPPAGNALAAVRVADQPAAEEDADEPELEIDEDFLRRIREA